MLIVKMDIDMYTVDELEDRLIDLAFAEDIGDGDHTTLCCIPEDMMGQSKLLVKHACLRAGIYQRLLIAVGHRCYSAHALHDIEHQALSLQQTLALAFHHKRHITPLHVFAVPNEYFHLKCRVKTLEYFARHLYSGNYTFLLDKKL